MNANAAPTPALFPAAWRWRGLLVCNLLTLIVLASWLYDPTRLFWDWFDDALFFTLNPTLSQSENWARIWALASHRPMDLVVAVVMVSVILRKNLVFPAAQVKAAALAFFAIAVLVAGLRGLVAEPVVRHLDLQRHSPSLVYEEAVRLSELFPDWEASIKDSSRKSFPGDHAMFALAWALFLTLFARGWCLAMVWLMTAIFMMPRLIAGAHWGSDDFVGGLVVALLAIGWGCYTPYVACFLGYANRVSKMFGLTTHSPG